jgi:hypothetical protein
VVKSTAMWLRTLDSIRQPGASIEFSMIFVFYDLLKPRGGSHTTLLRETSELVATAMLHVLKLCRNKGSKMS